MSLFRPEALESRQQSTLGRVIFFAPRYAGFLVFLIVCATVALVLFVVFGSYTRKATVMGEIVPVSGVIKVFPPQAGRIEAVLVRSGDSVAKGDALLRINSAVSTEGGDREQQVLLSLQVQDEALDRQLQRNAAFQEDFLRQMQARRASAEREDELLAVQSQPLQAQLALAAKNEARYRDLMKKDYVSKEAFEQRSAERLALDAQLQQLARQRHEVARQLLQLAQEEAQQLDSFAREANDLARQQAQVRAQMAEVQAQQSVVVQAPQDGVVSSVLLTVGQQAVGGVPLVVMVPQDAVYEAALYAPSQQMGFVAPGQRVFLRYGAYPYQKFGQYGAVVTDVAQTAVATQALTDTAFAALQGVSVYRIRAKLDQDYVQVYGQKQPLMAGMLFEADIVQEERRIYEWMLEPLFAMRERWSGHAE